MRGTSPEACRSQKRHDVLGILPVWLVASQPFRIKNPTVAGKQLFASHGSRLLPRDEGLGFVF